jgi:hypothetical protein
MKNRETNSDTNKKNIPPYAEENELLRDEEKKRGWLPLHDEPIGGG